LLKFEDEHKFQGFLRFGFSRTRFKQFGIETPPNKHQNMDKVSPDSRQEALDILYEISKLLNCQIDKETLSILVSLIELGVNPETLALAVKVKNLRV